MRKIKLGLLPRIILAIVAGIVCGLFFPDGLVRIFITINSLFGNFLGFIIPLLILGLVAPGIADLGKGAGRLLLITALLAYCFTLFSGFFTYFTCDFTYPWLLDTAETLTYPFRRRGSKSTYTVFYDRNAPFNGCDDLFDFGLYPGIGNVCYFRR